MIVDTKRQRRMSIPPAAIGVGRIPPARIRLALLALAVTAALLTSAAGAAGDKGLPEMPPGYFDEPNGLAFDEQVVTEKQEDGWRWKEFYYTSLIYQGQPIRVHALYAAPTSAGAERKVPAILATHGKFGAIRGNDPRYMNSVRDFARAGYAVLFYDWDPHKADYAEACTRYGGIDYFTPDGWHSKGNDWKDSLFYQQTMIARRGITWLTRQAEVQAEKIGVWGCSYGGIFISLVAGVDGRVAAANPVVFTSVFGQQSPLYSALPSKWSDDEVSAWRARFDSSVHLARRNVPILYTVATNDHAFDLLHAMKTFAAMNQPKVLLLGVREGHGFWAFDQTLRFFDHALKGGKAFPVVENVEVARAARHITARVHATGQGPLAVRFFYSAVFQVDQGVDPNLIVPKDWPWVELPARSEGNDVFSAQCDLSVIDARPPGQRLYCWKCGRQIGFDSPQCPADGEVQPAAGTGQFRAFGQVTDARGAIACCPLSDAIAFADSDVAAPAKAASPAYDQLPTVDGVAAALKPGGVVEIRSDVSAGKPMATLPFDLPCKQVGVGGYALFNWRKNPASGDVKTEGADTPTKVIRSPFVDTVTDKTFRTAAADVIASASGGRQLFKVNGLADVIDPKRKMFFHGAIPQVIGGADELAVTVQDDKEHRLTVIMADSYGVPPWARVSLTAANGASAMVRYPHGKAGDCAVQFRFKGSAVLKVMQSSYLRHPQFTVGPSAIFLD